MRDLRIVPATAEHADMMAPLLRPFDAAEIHIMFGPDEAAMLRHGIKVSSHAYAAIEGGVPFAIGGVVPVNMIAGTGAAWLLGTDGIARNSRWFLRASRMHLAAALDVYHSLTTTCDARYDKALRWLSWLGFAPGQSFKLGPAGERFVPFSIGRE